MSEHALATINEDARTLVFVPTGEVVSLDDPAEVGRAIERFRDFKRAIDSVVAVLTDEVVRESERQGTKTLPIDGGKIVVSGGDAVEWDLEALGALLDLGLPEERYNALVKTKVEYVVDARVAKQLASANEEYRRVIEGAQHRVPKPYRVSVKR